MWARVIEAALGIWLMAAPAILGYGGPAATHDRIVGPVIASIAIIAMAEVTRPLRWCTFAIGAWLLAAPWLLDFAPAARVNIIVGVLLLALGLVRGSVDARMGGGWSALWSPEKAARAQRRESGRGDSAE